MLHHTHHVLRTTAVLLVLFVATSGSFAHLYNPNNSLATAFAAEAGQTITIKPTQLEWSDAEIVNPMRGLYRWRGNENVPTPEVLPQRTLDAYDRYEWRELEKGRGEYDFSLLESDIAKAAAAGQQFSFRVRAMVNGEGKAVPDYLVNDMDLGWWADTNRDGSTDTYIPDWNDPAFLDGVQRLMNALGERYDNDPRISYLDIGIYGSWGEWHTYGLNYDVRTAKAMTSENRRKIIDFHIAAFPNTQLIMMSDDAQSLVYALEQSPRIGWRRDSLGDEHFSSVVSKVERLGADKLALLEERWKTAPVITEFINPRNHESPGSYLLAAEQVRRFHIAMVGNGNMIRWSELGSAGRSAVIEMAKASGYRFTPTALNVPATFQTGQRLPIEITWANTGVTPSYEDWQVWYQLRSSNGEIVWEAPSSLNMRSLLPTGDAPLTITDNPLLAPQVAAGTYQLTLMVRHANAERAPMALAITGRQADGSYLLGDIAVEVGQTASIALENYVYLPMVGR